MYLSGDRQKRIRIPVSSAHVAPKMWQAVCSTERVKKAAFRIAPGNKGFIQTTVAPVQDRNSPKFGWSDLLTLAAIVIGGLALARLVLAH
jgi:hypothetical protein